MSSKTTLYLVLITSFFALCSPTSFLIWDEVNYFEQAHTYASFSTEITPLNAVIHGTYPPGTSLLAALFIICFGTKACFSSSFLCLILSFILLKRILENQGLSTDYVWLLFLFPSVAILSRTLMSEMPVLLISTVFFYVLFRKSNRRVTAFLLGFLGTIGVLFREPMLLVTAPFLMSFFLENKPKRLALVGGAILGVTLRLLAAKLIFGNFFFMKDPGVNFGFDLFLSSIILYTLALLVFIPGGLWMVWKYSGRYARALKISVFTTLVFFSLYEFNGLNCGLLEGLILGPRFFIPSLPLFILAFAHFWKEERFPIKLSLLPVFALFVFGGAQVLGKMFNNKQMLIKEAALQNSEKIIYCNGAAQMSKTINNLDNRLHSYELKHVTKDDRIPVGATYIEYTSDSIFVKTIGNPNKVHVGVTRGYTNFDKSNLLNIFK